MTIDALEPDTLTTARRQLFLDMSPTEFRMWQHNPITAAYLQYLDDVIANWRDLAADLLEAGAYRLGDPHEDRNPDVVRGQLVALRKLRQISLEDIQGFYGKVPEEVDQSPSQDDQE